MTYKAMAERVPRTEETFRMGSTRTIRQRNGVTSTITQGFRDDGLSRREINIFANGARADAIADHIRPGMTSRLVGKYSQGNVFVALGVANG
jgi:hypothetical protein